MGIKSVVIALFMCVLISLFSAASAKAGTEMIIDNSAQAPPPPVYAYAPPPRVVYYVPPPVQVVVRPAYAYYARPRVIAYARHTHRPFCPWR